MADTRHNLGITTTMDNVAGRKLKALGETGKKAGGSIAAGFIKAQLALGGLKLAIRGVVSVVKGLTTDLAAQIDMTAKLAKQLGVSVEALSELGGAAEFAGSNLQEVGTSIRFLQRSLGEAQRGVLTYTDAFTKLGFTAADIQRLMRMDGVEAFTVIGEAIGGLETQSEKTAVAMQVFGRAGQRLFPLFAEGARGLRALREEQRLSGAVITKSVAAMGEAFVDAKKRLDDAIMGIKLALAEELFPTLTGVINKLAQLIRDNKDTILPALKEAITTALSLIASTLIAIAGGILTLIDTIEEVTTAGGLGKRFKRGVGRVAHELGIIDKEELGLLLQGVGPSGSNRAGKFEALLKAFQRQIALLRGKPLPPESIFDEGAPFEPFAVKDVRDRLRADLPVPSVTAGAKAGEQGYFDRFLFGKKTEDETIGGIRQFVDDVREATSPENLGLTTANMLTDAWGNFFNAIVTGAMSAGEAFKAMAVSILQDIARIANQRLFAELFSSLLGPATSAAGAGAGAGGAGAAAGTVNQTNLVVMGAGNAASSVAASFETSPEFRALARNSRGLFG